MTRLLLLDSGGPLGMVTHPKATGTTLACQLWMTTLLQRGDRFAIPEIADYEVRRELLRAGLSRSIHRLDQLKQTLEYLPLQTETMLKAAELWAQARRTGQPTADPKALDGDIILAAQAILAANNATEVIVVTTNVGHLSQFTTALDWQAVQ